MLGLKHAEKLFLQLTGFKQSRRRKIAFEIDG